jgi:tripartite-type tricarboxylate transporter receptor subunit TctC
MSRSFSAFFVSLAGSLLLSCAAFAQDFAGKNINVLVGYATGGGTDAAARLVANFYTRYLPGAPVALVRNIPGADGVIASNYFVQQVAADGLTTLVASSTTADPHYYRKPQSHFDPSKFVIIGGIGRGGTVLIMNKDAEARLRNSAEAPVVMGVTGGVPRSGMQAAAWGIEFLGWNARWVLGYRGTNDLIYALERREIDMTSTGNMFQIQKMLATGRFVILSQSGAFVDGKFNPRADFGGAPLMTGLVAEKIKGETAKQAFAYWSNMTAIDKWVALPPGSTTAMRDVYRKAFTQILQDPEFIEQSKKISDDFMPMKAEDVEDLVLKLWATPPEAITYISRMLERQGLKVD